MGSNRYPRRALIISVHNYLYANPIHDPEMLHSMSNFGGLERALIYKLKVPQTQLLRLSDATKKEPRPPLRQVIEKTLTDFLDTSRSQDRIMVFFVGHSKEIDGEAYLVPLEGELDKAATLIPLKWVYAQLAKCKARQKVLVLDVNRSNPGQGLERPASGEMTEKFQAALKNPPPGVQLWAACSAKQESYETDDAPLGVFLDSLRKALATGGPLDGRIPREDDLLPLDKLNAWINDHMKADLDRRGLKQVALLAGKPPEGSLAVDKTAAPARVPPLPVVRLGDTAAALKVLSEVSVPPIKGEGDDTSSLAFSVLPTFTAETMKKYDDGGDPNAPLRKAVRQARAVLWAISTYTPPGELGADIEAVKAKLKVSLDIKRDYYPAPGGGAAENVFKERVFNDAKEMSRIVARLQEALDDITAVADQRDKETPRWQANYDFIKARLLMQMAYLEEYQSLLGQMRKELPPLDRKLYNGWRLASQETMQGDGTTKKLAKQAKKALDEIADKYKDTPWAVLSKREKLTALGLDWKPANSAR
jgi:hypothetical protein